MSSEQYVGEVPFRHPNWSGSILSLTWSINQVTTKSSRTLDRQGVNEIGLKSPSSIGCCIFGMGIIWYSFQFTGTISDRSDVLKMVVIGSASSYANSLTMRHGTLSGPWALEGLMVSSFLQTSWGCADRTPASAPINKLVGHQEIKGHWYRTRQAKNVQISPRGREENKTKCKGCVRGWCLDKNFNLCTAFFSLSRRRFYGTEFDFHVVWVEVKRDSLKTTA